MQTKPLLYGLIGFLLGGLLVAIAATTFNKDELESSDNSTHSSMSMDDMTSSLEGKQGDEFDKLFISEMIVHHQGAVEMAKLAQQNAKHDEIKELSKNIIAAQEKEIQQMKQWQSDWGYETSSMNMEMMDH